MPTVTVERAQENHDKSKTMIEGFMAQNGEERFLRKTREILEKWGGEGGIDAYSDAYILNMVETCPYYLSLMLNIDHGESELKRQQILSHNQPQQ